MAHIIVDDLQVAGSGQTLIPVSVESGELIRAAVARSLNARSIRGAAGGGVIPSTGHTIGYQQPPIEL